MAELSIYVRNVFLKYFMPTLAFLVIVSSASAPLAHAVDSSGCKTGVNSFFGVPTWYEYLTFERVNDRCAITNSGEEAVMLVSFAVLDILFYLSGFIAAGYIIWGGLKFILAQGSPDKIASARSTILNAVIGLIIVIVASTAITYIARKLGAVQ